MSDAGNTRALLSDIAMMEHHLLCNHYPPVDRSAVPVALEVVKMAAEGVLEGNDDVWDEEVECPNGTTTIGEMVQGFHLDEFVNAKVAELRGDEDDE